MGILMPIRNQVMNSRGKLFDEQQIKALEVNYLLYLHRSVTDSPTNMGNTFYLLDFLFTTGII